MPISYVEFDLKNGYIVNWLSSGPQAIAAEGSPQGTETAREQIAERYYEEKSQISAPPVERGPLHEGVFQIGSYQGEWNYAHCREDRLVDHSRVFGGCHFARSWAYTELASPVENAVNFIVSTYGPVDLWVNKKHVYHLESFSDRLASFEFPVKLDKGINRVLVRFANVGEGAVPLAMALRVDPVPEGVTIRIPTLIPSIERRNQLEDLYERVYLDRDIYTGNQNVQLFFPDTYPEQIPCDARFQTITGRIYGQTEDTGKPGDMKVLGRPVSLMDGPYQALLMPRAWEYYESHIRIVKTLDTYVMGRTRYSAAPYGTPEDRRREALLHAAAREDDLFAEIAKMALGSWQKIERKTIDWAVAGVEHEPDGDLLLLGLLGALARFGETPEFEQAWKEQIQAQAFKFAYANEAPPCGGELNVPDRRIVPLTCAVLAGQLFPAETFTSEESSGEQLRARAESEALEWIRARGTGGFAAWDSKEVYAAVLAALTHLIDLAQSEALWELASVLVDQMLFTLALNSFGGVFGSTQGSASTEGVKSGLLEATSGITRVLWGMGAFNHHTAGTVSMACTQNYNVPEFLALIGADAAAHAGASAPEGLWNREQHNQAGQVVNKVTYRTANYLLASAQDYRAGEPGSREHIWQATLGPQSVVFTTHPGNAGEQDAHAPNYWLGNGVLPKVGQWKDTLVAIYNLPDDVWLDFTHAYFPTADFDEYVVEEDTIFGRKGSGYIALTAANGLEMMIEGRTAHRELRSTGKQNIWVCRMGQLSKDGDFATFRANVNGLKPAFDGLNLTLQTLRGETLQFGWERPLAINGEEQPLHGFPRYDNPYTLTEIAATTMEIRSADYLLRLNFGDVEEEQ